MEFILVSTLEIIFLFCLAVLIDWLIYRLRLISWPSLSSLRERFRSWRSEPLASGFRIRRISIPAQSLGSLRVTRARWEQLNGPPDTHGED
jgi:hypothetical protein